MSNIESRLWILGAPDPEMAAIEGLLRECGETVVYAADARGERVTAGTAYRGESLVADSGNHPCTDGVTDVYLVECELLTPDARFEPGEDICHPELSGRTVRRIDHHRPGDPGYGRPPSEFLAASSIGQVIAELARLGRLPEAWPRLGTSEGCTWHRGELVTRGGHPDQPGFPLGWWVTTCEEGETGDPGWGPDGGETADVPRDLVICAAADHCLGAAYRGECPGVDPDALMRWRAESRARVQGRTVEEVLADVELARDALLRAPELLLAPLYSPRCTCGGVGDCVGCTMHPDYVGRDLTVRDMRDAYTVRTVLVEPFVDGATVDAAGVGDSVTIEFGAREEGVWDEGGHHTFVRRGVPELPDAASRDGEAYLATVTDGAGRSKIVLGGATTPEMVRAFLDHWAPAQGLVDPYGDPQRGFAGAYMTTEAQ